MPKMLSDMEIEEISLVDDPANEQARVAIVKSKAGKKSYSRKKLEIEIETDDEEEGEEEGDMEGDGEEADPKMTRLKKALEALAPRVAQALAEGDSAHADAAASGETALKEYTMDLESLSKALEDAEQNLDTLRKRAEEAEANLATANEALAAKDAELAEVTKAAAAAPSSEEEVLKSLPEPVRKRIEESEARAKAAEEAVTKMREATEQAEAIEKARALKVPQPEKVGPLLLRVQKGRTTAEDAAVIEAVLKGLAEQKAHSEVLFKAIGSSDATDTNPEVLLKAKAEEIQKANTGMTFEQAYAKATESNPNLYSEYVAKRRAS